MALLPKIFFDDADLSFRQIFIFDGKEVLALQEIAHILDYKSIWIDNNLTETQSKNISQSVQFKLLTGENMSEISDAIRYFADKQVQDIINFNACCGSTQGGTGGAAGTIIPTSPITPPPNFTGTTDEYTANRCRGANLIVDVLTAVSETASSFLDFQDITYTIVGSKLVQLLGINWTFEAGLGLLLSDVVILSVAEVAAITAAVAAVGFIADVFFTEFYNDITSNRDDYVCTIYNATDSDTVTDTILTTVENALTIAGYSITQNLFLRAIFSYALSGTYLDRYFSGSYASGSFNCLCLPDTVLFDFSNGILNKGELQGGSSVVNGNLTWATLNHFYLRWTQNDCQQINSNTTLKLTLTQATGVTTDRKVYLCGTLMPNRINLQNNVISTITILNAGAYCTNCTSSGERLVDINLGLDHSQFSQARMEII